jgi:excisionase family DNA binding protein
MANRDGAMAVGDRGPREAIKTPATPARGGHGAGHGAAQLLEKSNQRGHAADRTSSASPALLTLRQAADYLAVSYWTVRSWADAGKLPVVRLPGDGRLVRVERAELERLIVVSRT